MKRIAILFVVGLLAGCNQLAAVNSAANTPVTAAQIASAKDISYGLEAGYDALLSLAVPWAKPSNRCGAATAAPPPACSTAAAVISIEHIRATFRGTIDNLNKAIADTGTTSSILSGALNAAEAAYASYEQALSVYGLKKGS